MVQELAAEFYNGGKRAGKFVDIVMIGHGWRRPVAGPIPVAGKVEARRVANSYGAKAWNF